MFLVGLRFHLLGFPEQDLSHFKPSPGDHQHFIMKFCYFNFTYNKVFLTEGDPLLCGRKRNHLAEPSFYGRLPSLYNYHVDRYKRGNCHSVSIP